MVSFLGAIRGCEYESIYVVTLFTGLREGEVLGLTWDCVDFKGGTITIKQQLQKIRGTGGEYVLVPTKNSKTRIISPANYVMQVLTNQRKAQNEQRLMAGPAWSNPLNLVFTNAFGKNLCAQTVYLHFKKLAAAAGVPAARFHDLRHPYVKHTTKIFSLCLMDFQAQAYPDARRKTRGACQLHRGGQSQSPVRPLCNRKRFS